MPTTPDPFGINLSVLVGTLRRPPERRCLPSGEDLLEMELVIRSAGSPAEVAPVVWSNAPAPALQWSEGDEILVVGRVRRRFFRSAGSTQSRTEVVAAAAVPTRRAASAHKVLRAAVARLESSPLGEREPTQV